jgi:ketosteroid isomerase-like protein
MTVASIRPAVEAFYRASASRDIESMMALIDDDVNWLVQGPIDVFSFFGQRRGKAAVLEIYREIGRKLRVTNVELETLVVDDDRAAAMLRLTSVVRATGKVMSVRMSQFSRFRDGKMIEMRAVCDSYDMVEQALGRALDLSAPELAPG